MKPPVRVVCRGCLRSVEIETNDFALSSGACPFCGQPIDSRQGGSDPTEDRFDESESNATTIEHREPTSEWTAAWSRGSLGVLGRFQLRDRLGDGGFGEVYLAYDPRLDRDVALKVLRQPEPCERVMERFFREARAAARLDHPNIVAVYDSGFDRGRCWVAYQRVSGRPLWWHMDHRPFRPDDAARIFRDLAEAVDYAHNHGVVHRDIKPANILIDEHGRPRLIDFGLARRADLDSSLTRDGAVVGTPAYMSPEQAQGCSRQVDERSDVFSLGVVFRESLTGDRFASLSTLATSGESARRSPETAGRNRSSDKLGIPIELLRICNRATADRPEDRYPNAREFALDLDAWLQKSAKSEKPRSRPMRKSPWLLIASVLITAVVLGVGFLSKSPIHGLLKRGAEAVDQPQALMAPEARDESRTSAEPEAPVAPMVSDVRGGRAVPNEETRELLVGNKETKRLHRPHCQYAGGIGDANRVAIESPEAAVAQGFVACKVCKPTTTDEGLRNLSTKKSD